MTTSSTSPLLKPLQIGRLTVPGRLYKSATSETRVEAAVKDQHLTCTAVHAFAVDRTVPVVRMRQENQ